MTIKAGQSKEDEIKHLKYEIRKRDEIIQNLRDANERLVVASNVLVKILGRANEESLDHDADDEKE